MRKGFKNNIKNRIGETKIMNCGEECEIVEYNGCKDITIRFLKTGEKVNTEYKNFKNGSIKSHLTPTIYGVGVVGFEKTRDENGKELKSYKVWKNVLQRCYSKQYYKRYPTYKGCTIFDEWLYYPNFKQWYEENYYEIDGEVMCLDKDILNKGNKVYSPETCIFVPQFINGLFVKCDALRGNFPIGVHWFKKNRNYQSACNLFNTITNKKEHRVLGYYSTPEEAFNVYKKAKEENIKLVADYYKDRIPEKLYNAMYKYEVKITD